MHCPDEPLTERDKRRLQELISLHGEQTTIEKLGVTRHALARVLGGLPIRRGTAALFRVGLASLDRLDNGMTTASPTT